MLDILEKFCNDAMTPELAVAVKDAVIAFDRIGLENYNDGYDEILMTDDISDSNTAVASICALTQALQHQTLAAHGIFVSKETSIADLTVFFNGILDIQDFEDCDIVLRLIDAEFSPEETLADLLALVTARSADYLLTLITDVTETLIVKIKEFHISKVGGEVSDAYQATITKYVNVLKRFMEFTGNENLSIVELLKVGLPVGLLFMVYASKLNRVLEEMKPEFAAQELYAAALVSKDGLDTPQAIILENLEHFVSDISHSTAITNYISDYQVRFTNGSK